MWPGGRWREWNVSDTGHDVFTGNLNQGGLAGLAAVWDISSKVTKWGVAVTQLQLVEGLVYCGKGVEFMGHKGAGCLDLEFMGLWSLWVAWTWSIVGRGRAWIAKS